LLKTARRSGKNASGCASGNRRGGNSSPTLIGWLGFSWISALRTIKTLGPTPIISVGQNDTQADSVVRAAREAEEKRKADEAEQQRLAAIKAEQERQARAAAEAEDKRKAEQADQQRLAAKAEQERQARAAAEAEAEQRRLAALKVEEDRRRAEAGTQSRISDAIKQGNEAINSRDFNKAIATYSEAIRLNPTYADAFYNRGLAYEKKGDTDRHIADSSEAIRLNPTYANAFNSRGLLMRKKAHRPGHCRLQRGNPTKPQRRSLFQPGPCLCEKGDTDRAIADYSEAIRLNQPIAPLTAGACLWQKGDTDWPLPTTARQFG
jgi:tetratricopeptide (TPR) repeat protein